MHQWACNTLKTFSEESTLPLKQLKVGQNIIVYKWFKKLSGTKTNPYVLEREHTALTRQPLLFHNSMHSACCLYFTNVSLGLVNIYCSFKILFKFHLLLETLSYSMASRSLIPSPNDTLKHLLPQTAFILHTSVFLITLGTSSGQGSSSKNLYMLSAKAPHKSSKSAAERALLC